MKVSWSKKAAKSAQTTTTYIYKEFGLKSSQKFLSEISHVCQLLEDNPYLGPIEPLLINKKRQYRSVVVNHLNKLVIISKATLSALQPFGTPEESLNHRLTNSNDCLP